MSISFERQARAAALPGQASAGLNFEISWSRLLKIGGAVSVLAIGAYAIMADQIAIATDNAVVSAYAIALRTPIDGVVGTAALRIGEKVQRGATLAEVNNIRVDDQRLIDLREHLIQARAHLAAIDTEQETLKGLRVELEGRSQAYVAASAARLAGSVAEAESALAALTARRDEMERGLNRRTALADSGFTSTADLDKARSDFDVASHEAEAQSGRLDSLRAQLAAVKNGVVSEPGSNDVAYSRQRADEIVLREADLIQQKALTAADVSETSARLDSEAARIERLRAAAMVAPASGVVWKINAQAGEHIGAGAPVVQIVDCDAAFIIAQVPQNRVPDIEIGSEAEFRLSGDPIKRHGVVASVTGDATGGDQNLAAVPFVQQGPTATVRIQMTPNGDGDCPVGRTARVLLPSNGPGLLSRLFSRFS
jgi:multidrug resistance efflux pump